MTNNVVHLQAFTELPSIAMLQHLLIDSPVIVNDFFLHETDTLFFPIEEMKIEVEKPEAYNKHYYLNYSHKRKKGKLKKYK